MVGEVKIVGTDPPKRLPTPRRDLVCLDSALFRTSTPSLYTSDTLMVEKTTKDKGFHLEILVSISGSWTPILGLEVSQDLKIIGKGIHASVIGTASLATKWIIGALSQHIQNPVISDLHRAMIEEFNLDKSALAEIKDELKKESPLAALVAGDITLARQRLRPSTTPLS